MEKKHKIIIVTIITIALISSGVFILIWSKEPDSNDAPPIADDYSQITLKEITSSKIEYYEEIKPASGKKQSIKNSRMTVNVPEGWSLNKSYFPQEESSITVFSKENYHILFEPRENTYITKNFSISNDVFEDSYPIHVDNIVIWIEHVKDGKNFGPYNHTSLFYIFEDSGELFGSNTIHYTETKGVYIQIKLPTDTTDYDEETIEEIISIIKSIEWE